MYLIYIRDNRNKRYLSEDRFFSNKGCPFIEVFFPFEININDNDNIDIYILNHLSSIKFQYK